jgi:hypothetical protein
MPTKEELMEQATEMDIEGRSTMNKAELEQAIKDAGGTVAADGDVSSTSGAAGHAEHEQEQAARGRPTGLAYREGR